MKKNYNFVDPPMLERTKQKDGINRFRDIKLDYQEIENGIILPYKSLDNGKLGGGVITADREYIEYTSLHEGLGEKYDFHETDVTLHDEEVVYIGMFHDIWGHCITDCIKKLWFLFACGYEKLRDKTFVYVPLGNFDFSKNFIELLSIYDIDANSLKPIRNISRYKKIYVPDDSFFIANGERYYTKEYKKLIDRLTDSIPSPQNRYDKVYFTRTKLRCNNKDLGEKKIEKIFRKMGYKIIAPEKFSFKKQLSILKGCDTFASTEGSISHNAVFLKEGSNFVLIRKAAFTNGYQFALNALKKLNVTYLDAHLSVFVNDEQPWGGPFFMYANNNLKRFANCTGSSGGFDYREFMKYTNLSFQPDIYQRRNTDVYYFEQLGKEIDCYKNRSKYLFKDFLFRLPLSDKSKERIKKYVKALVSQR